jgi:hypothetical protein
VAGAYLFLPDHAPEVHDETSATMPRPSQTQSNPVTPPRATAAHINVVQGANTNPANAQKKLSNAASQREVSIRQSGEQTTHTTSPRLTDGLPRLAQNLLRSSRP